MRQFPYERVELGNHASAYECRTCGALFASSYWASRHVDAHPSRAAVETRGEGSE